MMTTEILKKYYACQLIFSYYSYAKKKVDQYQRDQYENYPSKKGLYLGYSYIILVPHFKTTKIR